MRLSPESLDFLFENKIKDSKAWYQDHKEDYKRLVSEPFREFIMNMQPYIEKIDANLSCNPKRISRIYRDTRFTKDKSIFRDHVWYGFRHSDELYGGLPCYFFEFSPEGIMYGCGYYKADTQSIEAIRSLVQNHDRTFINMKKTLRKHPELMLYGEPYKRNHFPDAPAEDQPWLNIRDFCIIASSTEFDLLFSETQELAAQIGKRFIEMKPVYDFLMKAESKIER